MLKLPNTLTRMLFASLIASFTTSISAHEITAAVGNSLAPYIIQSSDSGIEIDIIREALAVKNHTLRLRYPPLKQVPVYTKKMLSMQLLPSQRGLALMLVFQILSFSIKTSQSA